MYRIKVIIEVKNANAAEATDDEISIVQKRTSKKINNERLQKTEIYVYLIYIVHLEMFQE